MEGAAAGTPDRVRAAQGRVTRVLAHVRPAAPPAARDTRTCVLTGAARGIGLEAARSLIAHGYADVLVVTDIDADAIREAEAALAREGRDRGVRVIGVAGDVTREDFAASTLAGALARAGIESVETLVLNAGYTRDAVVHKMTGADWDAMMAVHLTANFRIIRGLEGFMRGAAKRCAAPARPADGAAPRGGVGR